MNVWVMACAAEALVEGHKAFLDRIHYSFNDTDEYYLRKNISFVGVNEMIGNFFEMVGAQRV